MMSVSNPISGEVGAAAWVKEWPKVPYVRRFQTPSAGRWVLQPHAREMQQSWDDLVSNPISGEVGAAARPSTPPPSTPTRSFKPHQRGGGCCSLPQTRTGCTTVPLTGFKPHQRGGGCCSASGRARLANLDGTPVFQTPSAGRWVLQLAHQLGERCPVRPVSNPISGEVGAAARSAAAICPATMAWFQTPSAGRWVLQQAVVVYGFGAPLSFQTPVSNPISGEVGAAAVAGGPRDLHVEPWFQTPSAGRWVLQR